MRPSFGKRLKELRLSRNLRQDQVAEVVGVDKSSVSSYEIGDRQPSYAILVSLAKLFRVSTDYLLGITDDKNIDVSGLTDHEISVISELVSLMVEKNERLNE